MIRKKLYTQALDPDAVFLYKFEKGKFVRVVAKFKESKTGRISLLIENESFDAKKFSKSKWRINGGIASRLGKLQEAGFKGYSPTPEQSRIDDQDREAEERRALLRSQQARRKKRKALSPYFDKAGEPILKPSCCVVADVLGFSELIRESVRNNSEAELLRDIFSILDQSVEHMEEMQEPFKNEPQWAFKFYSDNMVIGYPLKETGDDLTAEAELGITLGIIIDHQFKLARAGYFIRGGLSYGSLHVSRDLILGAAMLDAHDIERQIADVPRIVLHPTTLANVEQHLTWGSSPHYSYLLIDQDGQVFINYLIATIPDVDVFLRSQLLQHRDMVTNRLNRFADEPRVLRKYVWLANYHNFFCKHFLTDDVIGSKSKSKEFKVTHKAARGQFKFLTVPKAVRRN